MPPIILEGETLGEKHQYYNKLIKQFCSKDGSQEIEKINFDEPDLHNLYKIDMAANKKKVEYIVEVLKCEDMLYVSRALKQSTWLITDKEYAHIINPHYLYSQLLRQMTSKAGHKLILNIRLNLKDENRVEEFYKYYEDNKRFEMALKWLPNCSLPFIENVVEKHVNQIPCNLILKLSIRSFNIFEICARKKKIYGRRNLISKSIFLLNNNAEKYLNIVLAQNACDELNFNSKSTRIIMNKCPDVLLNNFEQFARIIDIPTFAKSLKPKDIKDFLLKQYKNKSLKTWFNFNVVKHFIGRMPSEGRFDFIKRVFIDKTSDKSNDGHLQNEDVFECNMQTRFARRKVSQSSNANIYLWYRFAPFATAFTELKKLIRLESDANERNAMFAVLIICARKKMQNLQTVLQYYRDNHINEPFKFKSHFVNIVLSHSNTHRFDDKTWNTLNDIFCSMEVYSESENNVQLCLKHIIVYKVVNDAKVPDIVEKKFEFDSLKSFQNKLNEYEQNKLFDYLYQSIITKMQNITITTKTEFRHIKYNIIQVLNLLLDWKRDLLDYGIILEIIKELIQINNSNKTSWNEELSDIYNFKKSWRKHMFSESLLLQNTPKSYINALKHGPQILDASKEKIYQNDSKLQKQLLNKLRIYWPQSLAKTFQDTFLSQLEDKSKHKTSIKGLCFLLPKKQLIDIITQYKPECTKINWGETDEVVLSIQKHFAKYMYLARPQPPVDLVLLYGKGDYLQYALPSIYSILLNMSVDRSLQYIPTFLDAPVSLQKHGLTFAFTKLKTDEILNTCLITWKSNRNASIRATVFKLIFDLLCKEQNETKIQDIWNTLNIFIDSLTFNENKIIYVTLGKADNVPLSVKQAYCIKSYRYLKTLPCKLNCDDIIISVLRNTLHIMESVDIEFIAEVINDFLDYTFSKVSFPLTNIISACLLSAKSETIQTHRYERIFVPLWVKYLDLLKHTENQPKLKLKFNDLLERIHEDIPDIVLEKNMITPIKLFNDIHSILEKQISIEENYVLILTWKLAAEYMKIIDKYRWEVFENKNDDTKRDIIYLKTAPDFGKIINALLKEEIINFFPDIYRLFKKALKRIFQAFKFHNNVQFAIIKSIIKNSDMTKGFLLAMKMIPMHIFSDKDKSERSEIHEIFRHHPSAEVRMIFHS